MFDLTGRAAIVTGAGRGIGLGIARALLGAGADVLLSVRQPQHGEAALRSLDDLPGRATFCQCDVVDDHVGATLVNACVDAFGRLDIVVNNAGIFPRAMFIDMTADALDEVLGVNLRAPLLISQEAVRHMATTGTRGSIINITSIDALRPTVPGYLAYGASKAAAVQASRVMASEVAQHGIRVNSISPGVILDDDVSKKIRDGFAARVPLGRVGRAAEVGSVAVFLASEAASFVTGVDIIVDGGSVLR